MDRSDGTLVPSMGTQIQLSPLLAQVRYEIVFIPGGSFLKKIELRNYFRNPLGGLLVIDPPALRNLNKRFE